MNRQAIILYLFLAILFALILTKIYVEADLAVKNEQYGMLEQQIKTVQTENNVLEEQILRAQAFSTIDQEARVEGFTDASYFFLK